MRGSMKGHMNGNKPKVKKTVRRTPHGVKASTTGAKRTKRK